MKIKGSCLCGSVDFFANQEAKLTAVCHCSHCQKQTGSAFSIILCVEEKALIYNAQETLSCYADMGESGGRVDRYFCRACGSPIVSIVETMPSLAFIKAGTLEDTSWLEPTSHVWCQSAQPWVTIDSNSQLYNKGSKG